ncbi:MAG: tetratricopeptide repeat protein, partial [Chromatiaceae bacterium]|nr:tetratricopeptide repeat protein [Chromatiaceae bacterium]
ASDYLQRFRALDGSLARCTHVSDSERQDWIDGVKASLSIELAEKERLGEAAAGLNEEQVETLRQVFNNEAATWQQTAPEDGYQKVRAAVLSGDFFPDCPDPRLAYQQIVSTFSDAPRALRFAVDLMASRHHDEWTERLLRKAIALDPKYAGPWNNLGNLLKNHLDRYQEAEDAYRQAIALDPKSAGPWNNLGNLLQDHLDRYQEAEDAYRQAIALDPRDPYPLANLARLIAKRGTKDEADRLYRQAAGLAGELTAGGSETHYVELVLQAQLWLKNLDAAGLALGRLAAAAAAGNGLALFKIQEQARECHAIGLGAMLADRIDASDYADLLRPIALALRVAHSGPQALDGIPTEIRVMAEESLADIQGPS